MNPIPGIEVDLHRATSRSWFEEKLKETITYAKQLEDLIEGYKSYEQYLLARLKKSEGANDHG